MRLIATMTQTSAAYCADAAVVLELQKTSPAYVLALHGKPALELDTRSLVLALRR